jgi:MoxR-like ATPase
MTRFDLIDPHRSEPLGSAELARRQPPKGLHDLRASAPLYQVDSKLADAINVALALGAPLLVTGEPGTGKTQLGYYLAWYFGLEQPFELAIKSTTVFQDLLYRFDTVAYFRDGRVGTGSLDKEQFVSPGPLWQAIEKVNAGEPAIVLLDEIDKAPRDFPNDLLRELDQFRFVV